MCLTSNPSRFLFWGLVHCYFISFHSWSSNVCIIELAYLSGTEDKLGRWSNPARDTMSGKVFHFRAAIDHFYIRVIALYLIFKGHCLLIGTWRVWYSELLGTTGSYICTPCVSYMFGPNFNQYSAVSNGP